MLSTLLRWVDEVPPSNQALRYGNPAFRTWHARVVEQSESLMRSVLGPDRCGHQPLKGSLLSSTCRQKPCMLRDVSSTASCVFALAALPHTQRVMSDSFDLGRAPAATELASYFADSFGNATRIDYGTGHETTFVALLYCLVSVIQLCAMCNLPALASVLVFRKVPSRIGRSDLMSVYAVLGEAGRRDGGRCVCAGAASVCQLPQPHAESADHVLVRSVWHQISAEAPASRLPTESSNARVP